MRYGFEGKNYEKYGDFGSGLDYSGKIVPITIDKSQPERIVRGHVELSSQLSSFMLVCLCGAALFFLGLIWLNFMFFKEFFIKSIAKREYQNLSQLNRKK